MKLSGNKWLFIFGVAVIFALGAETAVLTHNYLKHRPKCEQKYDFINSAFNCTDPTYAIKKTGYAKLIAELENYVSSEKEKNKITAASIYYRDLVNGPTFGINAEEKFSPASLLKLPLAIAFYRLNSERSGVLDQKIIYEGHKGGGFVQGVPPLETVIPGQTYTTQELIRKSLVFSDNESTGTLVEALKVLGDGKELLIETLVDMGLIPPNSDIDRSITVRSYGGIFRLLYNASYLSLEDSNAVLSMLTRSTFNDGIRGGVPENISVAHKFGERENGGNNQLHDCGIIYFPKNPYLLCVMSQGDELANLEEFIKGVSERVYIEVDSRRN